MTNEAALFQILFQDDTLFRVPGAEPLRAAQITVTEPKLPSVLPATPQMPVPAPVSAPVPTQETPGADIEFPILQHNILVLADEPASETITASEYTLLSNILKAVGHSMEEVDILNFSRLPSKDARIVLAEKRTNYFITFGVPLVRLHLDLLLPPYTPKQIEGIWFLLADPLAVIETDVTLKKKLWSALKTMFPNT